MYTDQPLFRPLQRAGRAKYCEQTLLHMLKRAVL